MCAAVKHHPVFLAPGWGGRLSGFLAKNNLPTYNVLFKTNQNSFTPSPLKKPQPTPMSTKC